MIAFILAAGQGTRLMPLTRDKPKAMVDLVGTPLLQRQITVLRQAGVSEIVVIGGYKADALAGDFDHLVSNPDYASSNMVHTLFCAAELMTGGEDIIISYGDIIFQPSVIGALMNEDAGVATVIDRNWRALWETRMEDPLADAETLKLDDNNSIREIGRKPKTYADIEGQYIGLTKVRKDYVRRFVAFWQNMDRQAVYDGQDFKNMYFTSYLQAMIDAKMPVMAAFVENGWLEVDTVDDLETYQEMAASGALQHFIQLSE